MPQRSFLGDLLTTLFERRAAKSSATDDRSATEMCRALLDTEGEVSGLRLAKSIMEAYAGQSDAEKEQFFSFLNEDLDINVEDLSRALESYGKTRAPQDYLHLCEAAEPPRQELLRRLNQSPGATHALVQMRTDLLKLLPVAPALQKTDLDFRHLLRSWFNRGFLVLRQISWETPASILEKIVEYEAVHAINDWDDLRRRLYPPDRRCFAYFHPTMPDEPLIFVEVALTETVPDSIQDLLSESRSYREAEDQKVAVFYSISNCQEGLKGVSFGNLLIKQVVDELRHELPGLETFVTLSPIPGLNAWLSEQEEDPDAVSALEGTASPELLQALAARYLLEAKSPTGQPRDPVARFHLGNGAQIYAVHANADLSENGIAQSSGAMVNYQYDLDAIESNHERYTQKGLPATAPGFAVSGPARRKKRESVAAG